MTTNEKFQMAKADGDWEEYLAGFAAEWREAEDLYRSYAQKTGSRNES